MSSSKIKVAVAYHKPWQSVKDDIYLPIHVGASKSSLELGIQKDNEGDNISYLNPYYCEITALYFLWKNIKADYKGLCHYRRFLSFKKESQISKIEHISLLYIARLLRLTGLKIHYTNPRYQFLSYDKFVKQIQAEEEVVNKLLYDYDMIVPSVTIFSNTVREHFQNVIGEKPIKVLDQLMEETTFSYDYFELINSHGCNGGNISIMKNDIFNEYCEFLFPLLEKHMKMLLSHEEIESGKYLRISGYIAEMLTSLFIKVQSSNYKVYYTQVYYVDELCHLSFIGKILNKIGYFHPLLLKG